MDNKCQKCDEQIKAETFCPSKPKWCRICYVEYHREYRKKNAEKLRKAQYDRWINNKEKKLAQAKVWRERNHKERIEKERGYRCSNREKNNERIAKYRSENPEKVRETQRRYREAHREKVNAQAKLNYHVNAGNITKPSVCSMCEKENPKLKAHHYDYSKALEVEWLCSSCHKKVHMIMKSKQLSFKDKEK